MCDKVYNPNTYETKNIEEIRKEWIKPKGIELPEEIARGRILKTEVYKAEPNRIGDITEIAILYLYPGSEILEHEHTVDREVYYVNGLQLACEAGQSHSYENPSSEVISIVAIKQAVKL